MNNDLQQVGRLALRHEGDFWNAYYAVVGTMEGAILLGSIRMAAVANSASRKRAFMDLMRGIVTEIIEQTTGLRPTWGGPDRAPEHERAGSA